MHDTNTAGGPTAPRLLTKTEYERLRVRALADTTGYFTQRYRAEWLDIRRQLRADNPGMGPGKLRAAALKELRQRHRFEWGRVLANARRMQQERAGWVDGRCMNRRPITPKPEFAVTCSTCNAAVGDPCRRGDGSTVKPHVPRRQAFAATQPSPATSD